MSSVLQMQQGLAQSTPITVTTTTETLVAYTGRVEANLPTLRSIIECWLSITTGTGVTALVLNIRRGNGITGAIVATCTVFNTASQLVEHNLYFSEQLLNVEFADYSFTVTQTGATGNGSITNGIITCTQING